MKLCKTVQLRIVSHQDEISETSNRFVNALNYTSCYALEHREFTKGGLQKMIYGNLREKFGLKSQMTINCIREVDARYKGKHKDNRGKQMPVFFKQWHYALNYPRDYRIVNRSTISINTINGRVKAGYSCGKYQRDLIDSGEWSIASSVISIRRDGIIFINIAIEKEVAGTTLLNKDGIVGVDPGMNFVAVTADSAGKTRFYGGGMVKYRRWLHDKHRQEAQSKDTRSAKRFLKRQSGRERRFVTAQNHAISKDIVIKALETFNSPVISMEDLKGIRQQPYVGKAQRTRLAKWAFYQLQQFIEYKAIERGIPVAYINPAYTSQQCPRCGHIEKANRNKRLHLFKCKQCGYTSNDDRVGSMNIRDRGVIPRYIRETRGLVNGPDAADDDVEAPPGELIRSPATSHVL